MVSEGILALLSACCIRLEGRELAIARDQVRMTLGCLKALGEIWPRTARNVREIQMIAQHVLGLEENVGRTSSRISSEQSTLDADETEQDCTFESSTIDDENMFGAAGAVIPCDWIDFGGHDDLLWAINTST